MQTKKNLNPKKTTQSNSLNSKMNSDTKKTINLNSKKEPQIQTKLQAAPSNSQKNIKNNTKDLNINTKTNKPKPQNLNPINKDLKIQETKKKDSDINTKELHSNTLTQSKKLKLARTSPIQQSSKTDTKRILSKDSYEVHNTEEGLFIQDSKAMFELAKELFPICRSITGDGFRQSLKMLDDALGGGLEFLEIKSGTKVFDWFVPEEWYINDAYIITPEGEKICDFKKNNLHIVNYSTPIDTELELKELDKHLYSLEDFKEAIPYVTSYYERRWGFCLSHQQRLKLKEGKYKVFIDSGFRKNGVLNYAELLIKSSTKNKDEILISSYLCHPSMANNELSGPIVAIFLAKWLRTLKTRKYNYRFIFIPETIGSIVYLSKNLKHLKKHTKAGFVLTCIGDDKAYTLIHSPSENTLADKVALHTLKNKPNFKEYDFLQRGSDERQFCSPLVDLPVVSICRTKHGDYKEYHTHLDDLSFISEQGLANSLKLMQELVLNLENNAFYQCTTFCEPNLGRRKIFPTIKTGDLTKKFTDYWHFLAYANGKNDMIDLADKLDMQVYELCDLVQILLKHKLIKRIK